VPERSQASKREQARLALNLLDEHIATDGDEWIGIDRNLQLLAALAPFDDRPKLWLRLQCSCKRLITKGMYHGGGIFLGHETREKLPDGSTVIRPAMGPTPNVELVHFPRPAGFEQEPAGAHVWARRMLRCPDPQCQRTFTYRSAGLLRIWLEAVASGSSVLELGEGDRTASIERQK